MEDALKETPAEKLEKLFNKYNVSAKNQKRIKIKIGGKITPSNLETMWGYFHEFRNDLITTQSKMLNSFLENKAFEDMGSSIPDRYTIFMEEWNKKKGGKSKKRKSKKRKSKKRKSKNRKSKKKKRKTKNTF